MDATVKSTSHCRSRSGTTVVVLTRLSIYRALDPPFHHGAEHKTLDGDARFTVEGTHFRYQPHWNHSIIYLNSAFSPCHIKIEFCLPGSNPGVAIFLRTSIFRDC